MWASIPTRTGIVDALQAMGATDPPITMSAMEGGEPVADLEVQCYGELHGATFGGEQIVTMIDELPLLAVVGHAGARAHGCA
jgi:3-phosphoshikimate 1-carboxyvinyltransferase